MFKDIDWKKVDKRAGYIIIPLILLWLLYMVFDQEYQLWKYPRYTIGTVTEIYRSGHLVEKAVYVFIVNGIVYERQENRQDSVDVGDRCYVKFSSKSPKHSDYLQDSPVSDSIKVAPPEGWAELPKEKKRHR